MLKSPLFRFWFFAPSFQHTEQRQSDEDASSKLPSVTRLTAEDHQLAMGLLHMTTIRRGRDGSPDSPYTANYDESKANPFPDLPDPLVPTGKAVSA